MVNRSVFRKISYLFFALSALTATALAQNTSNILGTIVDPAGATVPNAQVKLTEAATGTVRNAASGDQGTFRFNTIPPGTYAVRVEASGFKATEVANIQLVPAETRDLGNVTLQIGTQTEEVSVEATVTPVQTASSERSSTVDSSTLDSIALKGRDPFGFMQLMPGIVDTTASRDLANAGSMIGVNVNGLASGANNVQLDGIGVVDSAGVNSTYVTPNLDAIGEVRILTNGFQAEYGRNAGANINFVTKSGTKSFHGSGHWDYRNEGLNANSFFNNRSGVQKQIYRYQIGGYSIGGPVLLPKINPGREKFFFFLSQEFTKTRQPASPVTANEPTDLERAGNFSQSKTSLGALLPVYDPTLTNGSTRVQFTGNIIPPSRIDATGQALLNLLPKPTGYVNPAPGQQYTANFIDSEANGRNRRDTIMRIDANLTSKIQMYYRLGLDSDTGTFPNSASVGLGHTANTLPGRNHAVHMVHAISSTLVNEALFGLGGNNYGFHHVEPDSNYFRSSSLNPPTLRPFPTGDQYLNYLPGLNFAGGNLANPPLAYTGGFSFNPLAALGGQFGNASVIPYQNSNDIYSFKDDLSWIHGQHSFKFGMYWEKNVKSEPNAGNAYNGQFNFGSNNFTNPLDSGDGYANAILGNFQTYTESTNRAPRGEHYTQVDEYAQDSWRITRRLTLELGVRFVHQGSTWTDVPQSQSNFDPSSFTASSAARLYRPAVVNGANVAIDPATGKTTFFSLVGTIVPGSGSPINGMKVGGILQNGLLYKFPYLAAAPRIGFAWDPFGDGKTSVRGAAGIFYNRDRIQLNGYGAAPVVYTPVIYYGSISGLTAAASSAALSATAGAAYEPNFKLPRDLQTNLTVQRDIGFGTVVDVGYVGSFARHASQTLQINPVPYRAYANPANIFNNGEINQDLVRSSYPGMGAISYTTDNLSNLNYHSLQTALQHRLTHGLQFGATYTFSKSLGTQGWDPWTNQRQQYYGPNPQDRSHVFAANYSYTLPKVAKMGFVGKYALSDWTISGIITATTGSPISPTCSSTAAGAINADPSLSGIAINAINGTHCQAVADPKSFTQDFYHNFNTAAFTLAAPNTFGNTGIGVLRQPGFWNTDMTVDKRIPLPRERMAFRIRFQAYNLFNHTEFNTIGTTLQLNAAGVNQNTTWGQYTAAQPNRVLALSTRFEF
jgi:hypothetical protein